MTLSDETIFLGTFISLVFLCFTGLSIGNPCIPYDEESGGSANLPGCGGPSLGVDLLGVLFGTGEIKKLEMTQVLVGSIQNPTKSHNIGRNRRE